MSVKKIKSARNLERYLKGLANHRRIEIFFLVAKKPGITVDEIADTLKANQKTISEHARKVASAGLIEKRYVGTSVEHRLTPYGEIFFAFLKEFSNS